MEINKKKLEDIYTRLNKLQDQLLLLSLDVRKLYEPSNADEEIEKMKRDKGEY
jgi:hypothetical protein